MAYAPSDLLHDLELWLLWGTLAKASISLTALFWIILSDWLEGIEYE